MIPPDYKKKTQGSFFYNHPPLIKGAFLNLAKAGKSQQPSFYI